MAAGNSASPMQASPDPASKLPPDVSQLPPVQAALALGNWNYDHENWAEAVSQYQKAISMGLDNANIRTDLGNSFRHLGECGKALEQYQNAQSKDPRHENSLINLAVLYSEFLHDPVNAVATLQDYLRRFPNGQHVQTAQQLLREINSSSQPAPGNAP
jgi:tetratricopeptide (TPR) repeat protein